jgi:hypothetical protein
VPNPHRLHETGRIVEALNNTIVTLTNAIDNTLEIARRHCCKLLLGGSLDAEVIRLDHASVH